MNIYCSDCTRSCSTTNFILQISSLLSPAEWQMKGIKAFVDNTSVPPSTDWSTNWGKYIPNSYLSVSVVRETTIIEKNT